MTAAAIAAPAAAGRWPRHLGWLGATWLALLLLFRRDVADLAGLWWTSTTYGHCLFIPPVVAWLVWQRRAGLRELVPVAWAPGLALVAAGAGCWWIGDAASVALFRQLGLVAMLDGAVVALLGPNVARGLVFPMTYLGFAVPFGAELEPPLQQATVAIVMPLLALAGVPATSDGVLIHAGRYWFEVAEACSGAKFVVAMAAFGVLVAHLCFRSWHRRTAFMAAALVVPVLANGVRAFATIYAAHLTSVEAATGFDHIVYGWVFFALVMAGVLALGWRWFDRAPDDPAFDPARLQRPVARRLGLPLAAASTLAVAGLVLAWSGMAQRPAPLPARIALPEVPGWRRVPLSGTAPWQPFHPGADHVLFGRYANAAGDRVDIGVALFAGQAEGRELVAFGTGVLREDDRWVRVADLAPVAGGRAMRITAPGPVERVVATWYRVGDAVTADPLRVKLETLRERLLARPAPAMALHLSTEGADPRPLARFVVALGAIDRATARIGAGAR
jgi:exosortase A